MSPSRSLWALITVVACETPGTTPAPPAPAPDAAPPADASKPPPGEAAPAGANLPQPADGVCERFGRARPGETWAYLRKPIAADEPTSQEHAGYTVTEYDRATGKLRLLHKRTTTFPTSEHVALFDETYRCDEHGLWMVSQVGPSTGTFPTIQSTSTTQHEDIWDPPFLVLPAVVEVGARWQSKSTQRHTITPEGKPPEVTTNTIDRTCEVMLKEELTVPAGTFQALRVDCAPVGGTSKASAWYADGVGLIQYAEAGAKLIAHSVNK